MCADVEATGRRIGHDLAPLATGTAPEERMHGVLAAMGFHPRRRLDSAGALTYCLDNCPHRTVGVSASRSCAACTAG